MSLGGFYEMDFSHFLSFLSVEGQVLKDHY